MQRRTLVQSAALAAAGALMALPAMAQTTWPTGKAISYVVPLPPVAPPTPWPV